MKISCVALNCLTNFSFLQGASHAEQLVARAAELGYSAIAVTDECSMSGMVRAHIAARECGLKLIVGAEFALHDAPGVERLLLLAKNREGYGDLCELITLARSRMPKGEYRLLAADLVALDHCITIILPRQGHAGAVGDVARVAGHVCASAGNGCWLGASLDYGPDDESRLHWLEQMSIESGLPLAACERILFATREQKPLQDVLAAVRMKKTMAAMGSELRAHAENYLKPIGRLAKRYPLAVMTQTLAIAASCKFSLDELRYEYPPEVVPPGDTPAAYLRDRKSVV